MWPAEFPGGERRFLALLAVSAALHVLVLTWVRMPEMPRQGVPAMLTVLNASLRVEAPVHEAAPLRSPQPVPAKALKPSPMRRVQPAVAAFSGPVVTPSEAAFADFSTTMTTLAPSVPDPVPASAPASAPEPAAALPAAKTMRLVDDYGRRLSDLFSRQQQYPRLAALRGWEGEVRVRLSVARQGNLTAVRLESSSGYEVLDRHALAMAEAIGQLPPPPAELIESSIGDVQVVVPVHYKLRKPV
jgi:protein TonB